MHEVMDHRTFNHFPIIAQGIVPQPPPDTIATRIVLVDRGERSHDRYVSWEAPIDRDCEGFWGHYTDDLTDARIDFINRLGWFTATQMAGLEADVNEYARG